MDDSPVQKILQKNCEMDVVFWTVIVVAAVADDYFGEVGNDPHIPYYVSQIARSLPS